jgi:hypothetical protein
MKIITFVFTLLISFEALSSCVVFPEHYKSPNINQSKWIDIATEKESYFIGIRIPVPLTNDKPLTSIGLVEFSEDKKNEKLFIPLAYSEQEKLYMSFFSLPKEMMITSSLVIQFGSCGELVELRLKNYLSK